MLGKTIGRYEILAELGRGANGVVWKARHTLLPSRLVALKVLSENLWSSAQARDRFLREAIAVSKLDHPGIATLYDAEEVDGQLYIAFKLIDGGTVAQRTAKGPLPLRKAVMVGRDAAEALAHAHAHGVIHRDLSAGNIMVDREGRGVLVDFGLARAGEQSATLTTGMVAGTLPYMPPETLRGEAVDARSDIYSLGAVMYRMITGRTPFEGEHAEEIVHRILNTRPAPPSASCPAAPPELDDIVLRALEKNPRDRYANAAEMARTLGEVLERPALRDDAHQRVSPVGRLAHGFARTLRRRSARWAVGIGTAAVVAVTALGIAWLDGWRPDFLTRTPTVAVLPLRNLSEDPSESGFLTDGFGEQLADRLSDLQGLLVLPWLTTRGIDPSRTLPAIARQLHTQLLVTGSYRTDGDSIHVSISVVDGQTGYQRWAQAFDRPMEDLLSVQADLATSVAERLKGRVTLEEKNQLAVPAARNGEAWEFYLRGAEYLTTGDPKEFAKAESFFDHALELDPQLAEAHVGLGAIHNATYFGQLGPGERDLEISREHFDKALEINPNLIAALRGRLQIHLDRDETEECLKIAQKAKAMGSHRIEALLLAGEAYSWGLMPDKAIPFLERAIELDPASPAALWDLVYSLQWTGQNKRAFQAGATYLERFGEDTEVYLWMGVAANAMGSHDTAAAMFDRAIETGGETRDLRTDEVAVWFYLQRGRPERAKELLSRMATALEGRLAAYPSNARVRSSLVEVYALLGRKADALHQLEVLMPQISRPGYRDQAVPAVAVALLYLGCVEQARQVFGILRRGDIAGSWGELKIYGYLMASMVTQAEFRRFRAEGEAALTRLRAKYGG